MKSLYLYQDKGIGFYEHRIDFLRNGYNYASIEYYDIRRVIIKKGLIKNWIILFVLGFVSIILAGFIIHFVYANSLPGDFISNLITFWKSSRSSAIIAVLFLIAFGLYSIVASLKKTIKIFIITRDDRKQFDITSIHKDNKLDLLFNFLNDRVPEILMIDLKTQPNKKYT